MVINKNSILIRIYIILGDNNVMPVYSDLDDIEKTRFENSVIGLMM